MSLSEFAEPALSQISPLTKAIRYVLDPWSGVTSFLDDGRIEPDTNIVERPIRSIAIGKKNSLFCGDPDSDGEAQWARSRNLACRRLAVRRLRRNDQRSSPRVSGLELENRARARDARGVIRGQLNRFGSAVVSASRVSAQIASLISRSVVCSK